MSPTSEQFDGIKIITRNSNGEIITMPIKVRLYNVSKSRCHIPCTAHQIYVFLYLGVRTLHSGVGS